MALSSILKKLMAEKGILSGNDLSKETGIPQPTIHRLLAGKTKKPQKEAVRTLSEFFSVSINQIIGNDPLPTDKFNNLFDLTASSKIPLLAWEDCKDWHESLKSYQESPEVNWIPVYAKVSDVAFAVLAKDSTMEPKFPEGSVLVFDPKKEAKDRSYVLVYLKQTDTLVFKQLITDGITKYLKSLNPDLEHAVYSMEKDDEVVATLIQSFINYGE